MAAHDFSLGIALPITSETQEDSGTVLQEYPFGVLLLNLARLVIQKINSDPGILPNVELKALHLDTHASIKGSMEAAMYFCHDEVDNIVGIIGELASSRSVYIAQVATVVHMPQLSFTSTSPILSDKDRFPTFLRTCPPDTLQGACLADIVKHYDWKIVNTFSTDDDYGSKCIEAFHDRAHEIGILLGVHQSFNEKEANPAVFGDSVEQLKATGIRVTVGCAQIEPLRAFFKSADESGLLEVGYAWLTSETAFLEEDDEPEMGKANILGSSPIFTNGNSGSELWKDVIREWDHPDSEPPAYGTYLVDAIYMYAEALDTAIKGGLDPLEDREGFLTILKTTEHLGGATGDVILDKETGDRLGGYEIVNTRLREGLVEHTTIGTWSPSTDGSAGELWLDPNKAVLFAGDSPVVPTSRVAGPSSSSTDLVSILLGVAAAVVLLCAVFYHFYRRMSSKVSSLNKMVAFTAEQEAIVKQTMEDVSLEDTPHHSRSTAKSMRLKFDDIKLGEKLGFGAFGDVWAGELRGVACAVKCMLPDRITADNVMMFRREIDLLRRMSHPNVIRFMGACWDPPNVLLVLELAQGSVHDRITNPELPRMKWREGGLRIAMDVARGMGYMHSLAPPVMHRDIKSHNVLLTKEGQAKLTDFGSSREITDTTMTQIGSHFWLPPEVFLGKRYDEKCDVYSYAIFLCELAVEGGAVRGVFDGVNFAAIPVQLVSGWRPSLTNEKLDMSLTGLAELVERCWQTEPALRPSFDEVYEDLDGMLNNRVVEKSGVSTTLLTPVPEDIGGMAQRLGEVQEALKAAQTRIEELEKKLEMYEGKGEDQVLAPVPDSLDEVEEALVTAQARVVELEKRREILQQEEDQQLSPLPHVNPVPLPGSHLPNDSPTEVVEEVKEVKEALVASQPQAENVLESNMETHESKEGQLSPLPSTNSTSLPGSHLPDDPPTDAVEEVKEALMASQARVVELEKKLEMHEQKGSQPVAPLPPINRTTSLPDSHPSDSQIEHLGEAKEALSASQARVVELEKRMQMYERKESQLLSPLPPINRFSSLPSSD